MQNQPDSDLVLADRARQFWPNGSGPETSHCSARIIRTASGQCFSADPDRMRIGSGMFTGNTYNYYVHVCKCLVVHRLSASAAALRLGPLSHPPPPPPRPLPKGDRGYWMPLRLSGILGLSFEPHFLSPLWSF